MQDKHHALPSIAAFKTLDVLLASQNPQVATGLPADGAVPPNWYALVDVSAHESLKHAKQALQALKADVTEWINLYDDLDGLELKEHGPRFAPLTITATEQADVLISTDALRGISLIAAHAPLRQVANHLRALREATLPDGTGALFRFQDTRVIAAMAPHLDNAQCAALLGPAVQWICCDVCGDLSRVWSTTTKPSSAPLRLTAPVLAAVDAALLPHELLAHVSEAIARR